jgi:hypothetical protein
MFMSSKVQISHPKPKHVQHGTLLVQLLEEDLLRDEQRRVVGGGNVACCGRRGCICALWLWVAGDLRGEDGGVGGAAFQGPRVPVAAAAVRATAAVGAVEGRCGAGVNSDRTFGGMKSGVQCTTS